MSSYVTGMVADLTAALDGLDKSLRNQSNEHNERLDNEKALTNEIRFHNELIEYVEFLF